MDKGNESMAVIIPGEHIAMIEEFEGGKNTYVLDGDIRAATVGIPSYDLKRHIVKIKQKNSPILAKIGDIVVGYVEMLFGNMLNHFLYYFICQSIRHRIISPTCCNQGFVNCIRYLRLPETDHSAISLFYK